MFSMQLEDEVVMNIDVNTTSERLEQYLRRFSRIHNVSVAIYPGDDNPYNDNRVCSDVGNTVNITFYRADFPEYHGDIPSLKLNRYNDNPDALTRLSQVSSPLITCLIVDSYPLSSFICVFRESIPTFSRAQSMGIQFSCLRPPPNL